MNEAAERLFVAWRRPDGLVVPVGVLSMYRREDVRNYEFVYLKNAERQPGFQALPGLVDLHEVHRSPTLFPVFANRVMPRDRPDYERFLEHLDLTADADPFEVLARSEGHRATDRIEVFPQPSRSDAGELTTVFFARAIRHIDGADQVVAQLAEGDELQLLPDLDNPVTSRAVLLNAATSERVGWVPDYLLDLLHDLRDENAAWPVVRVEHVNPIHVPAHLRLLCRLSAPWPSGYQPFTGPDFQPLATA